MFPEFRKYARSDAFIGTKRKIKVKFECLALCGFICFYLSNFM